MIDRIRSEYRQFKADRKRRQFVKSLPIKKDRVNVFVLQTPTHSNIGDHAIAEAEFELLRTLGPEYNIIEVNQGYHYDFVDIHGRKPKFSKRDIIMLHGGGNFGNQYMREEKIRRATIEAFPNNRIISFPQTIFYTDDEDGLRELEITKDIVRKHQRLTLIARENTSYQLMQSYFPETNILLTPDIVLSLDRTKPELSREGVLMVLRADAEKILTDEQSALLDVIAKRSFSKVTYSDMHYHQGVRDQAGRDEVLSFKFGQFKTAELVITDRLHGMVFAAITGTPCIAFSNYNQKVSGTYEWIKDLNYIRFVSGDADLESEIEDLKSLIEKTPFSSIKLGDYYSKIIDAIKND